ncbi:MAG TPA: hypothetical protein VKT77_18690, partial [Chthonomonadaceae bacterium]|nr:hypothetical protein [Chthonomonadaceae bacterium]
MQRAVGVTLVGLVSALFLSSVAGHASPAAPSVPDAVRIERLAGLGRAWGAVKFFHPYVGSRDIDWDRALVDTIPKV